MHEEEQRTEIIDRQPPPRTESVVHTTQTPAPAARVDQTEAVAYDPYQSRRAAAYRVSQIIYWVFGLIIGLIAIRFILKALGANPDAGFAEFIYGVTSVLVAPFVGLFGNPQAQGSVLEVQSLVAIVVYALVAWLLVKLAWIVVGEPRSAVTTRTSSVDSRAYPPRS
jgi:uncharacterized membrane protein